MKWYNTFLVVVLLFASSISASAGGIFSKRPVVSNPNDQVQQLIQTVTASANPSTRARAVADLREYDAATYVQIIPVLVNALKKDPSVNVRLEAARSLGRIRPLTPLAGDALAAASTGDSAIRVRWQARASLLVYTVAGVNPNNRAKEPGKKQQDKKSTVPNYYPNGPYGNNLPNIPQPLPKGPKANVPIVPVKPGARPMTVEPPLAKDIPTLFVPPTVPMNSNAPLPNVPQVPINQPPTIPTGEGPILIPPKN